MAKRSTERILAGMRHVVRSVRRGGFLPATLVDAKQRLKTGIKTRQAQLADYYAAMIASQQRGQSVAAAAKRLSGSGPKEDAL